ncbi:MAG: uracil phosphoribosyltransferase [Miltoncostaeaceae bacterium]|nr:uracil phosphoribosyltransferase [Miltoncostaeaceae bacterium]
MPDPPAARPPVTLGGSLVAAQLAVLRDAATPPSRFRRAAAALGALVIAEALRGLETVPGRVDTPVGPAAVASPARRLTIVPVLRAGLALLEPALALAPAEPRVGFIGLARDETTLLPTRYLESLPAGLEDDDVLLLEPMVATGGSSVAAIDTLVARGARSIGVAALIAAPEGLEAVGRSHPGVQITCAAVDPGLDDRGFIVPGLGDAGDRLYAQPERA